MATRAEYRASLVIKLKDAANSQGDKLFTDTELNEFLAAAPRRAHPNIYKLTEFTAVTQPASDGTLAMADLTPTTISARDVTRVWDDDGEPIYGWTARGETKLSGFSGITQSIGGIEYKALHAMPATDVEANIPSEYYEIIILNAALCALESLGAERLDFKGYQPSGESGVDENEILNIYDTLSRALEREYDAKYMSLPAFGV